MLQEQMVSPRQGDETGPADAGSQLAPEFEWNDHVVPHVHYKRRRLHLRQKISDIEIADDVEISRRALGRGRSQLQFIEIVSLLVRSPGNESRGEHLPKAWVVRAPSEAHKVDAYRRLPSGSVTTSRARVVVRAPAPS